MLSVGVFFRWCAAICLHALYQKKRQWFHSAVFPPMRSFDKFVLWLHQIFWQWFRRSGIHRYDKSSNILGPPEQDFSMILSVFLSVLSYSSASFLVLIRYNYSVLTPIRLWFAECNDWGAKQKYPVSFGRVSILINELYSYQQSHQKTYQSIHLRTIFIDQCR